MKVLEKPHFDLLRTATGTSAFVLLLASFSDSEAGYRLSKGVRIVSKFCLTFTEGLLYSRHSVITEDNNVSIYSFDNIC